MGFDFSDYDGLPEELTPQRLALFGRLHQLETWFRELVYVETKAHYGALWWDECRLALKRNKDRGIDPEKSLRRDARHLHMATPENDPLWFVSFDSLLKILFDRKLWKLFLPYLTTKQLVRAKFVELMPTRHRIAHCRAIHPDDLSRVEHILKDFDRGFWRFCTSYNDDRVFRRNGSKLDPVFAHVDRLGARSSRISPAVSVVVRPSAPALKGWSAAGRKGALYNVRFIAEYPTVFKSSEVLRYTQARHAEVVHVFLDSDESSIRVTIPAVLGAARVIEIIDGFDYVCRNSTSPARRSVGDSSEDEKAFDKRIKDRYAAMRLVAEQWPHYVIPPGNPLSFLDPNCPCSFFGVS